MILRCQLNKIYSLLCIGGNISKMVSYIVKYYSIYPDLEGIIAKNIDYNLKAIFECYLESRDKTLLEILEEAELLPPLPKNLGYLTNEELLVNSGVCEYKDILFYTSKTYVNGTPRKSALSVPLGELTTPAILRLLESDEKLNNLYIQTLKNILIERDEKSNSKDEVTR